jgi:hypothetical protein
MAENFNLIFGSNAPDSTTWTDADYQTGWATVGSTPPTAEQFDFLQNRADLKAKELKDTIDPLVQEADKNNRQPTTAYALDDMAYNADLPTGWYLLCTTAGTSSSSDLSIVSPTLEATVSDGTVVWTIKKIGSTDGVLTREITPAFNSRDVITTSGTYTAPVTGWYKIIAKGGGGGGAYSSNASGQYYTGGGGGEGGVSVLYQQLTAGDTVSVVIGGGGAGATTATNGIDGGNTTFTINGNTTTAYGGEGGAYNSAAKGKGGDGNYRKGFNGEHPNRTNGLSEVGSNGGGYGGGLGVWTSKGGDATANTGCGGAGGSSGSSNRGGGAGADGFVSFEYFATI